MTLYNTILSGGVEQIAGCLPGAIRTQHKRTPITYKERDRERKKQYRAISTNAAKHIYIAPMEMKIRTANASQMIPFFSQKHTM